jgi:hypothetical protein
MVYPSMRGKAEQPPDKRSASMIKKIPILKTGLVVFVVIVVALMFCLAARMSTMGYELKQIKAQLAEIQGSVGTGNEASNIEREKLKTEIAELKREVDAMKARQRHQAEAASPGNAAEAKKKDGAGAKKTNAKEKPWWHFGL